MNFNFFFYFSIIYKYGSAFNKKNWRAFKRKKQYKEKKKKFRKKKFRKKKKTFKKKKQKEQTTLWKIIRK